MLKHIQDKYYTYVPGEFTPILRDGILDNKKEFHQYKLARAKWRIANWKLSYYQITHHAS